MNPKRWRCDRACGFKLNGYMIKFLKFVQRIIMKGNVVNAGKGGRGKGWQNRRNRTKTRFQKLKTKKKKQKL